MPPAPKPIPPKKRLKGTPTSALVTSQDQFAERRRLRALELQQRKNLLHYWQQRDLSKVPILQAIWKARDETLSLRRRVHDYFCIQCNRPFARPTQFRPTALVYCPECARAIRSKKNRDNYRARREVVLERAKKWQQDHKKGGGRWPAKPLNQSPPLPKPTTKPTPAPLTVKVSPKTQPRIPANPAVVWSPESDES